MKILEYLLGTPKQEHEHAWLPTVDGTGWKDNREMHCRGCGKFRHLRPEGYIDGRNPHRHRCVQPQAIEL